ncbi:MAG: flippase-like domain-containing protein [Anaerolineae bacterium]|nr:flippase-like domain-containing protein [Anaerolineae bacterium]
MKSRNLRLVIGVLISAVFIWLALRGLHLPDVWVSLRSADYIWLIPSIAVYFLAVWARTWRWDYLLRPMKQIPLRRLFPVVVIGYMGNNVYPFRAGELLRAFVLRQQEDVSMSSSLATIVVERVFDGLVMLLFVFVALPFAPLPSDTIRMVVIGGSVVFLGALLVFFAVAAVPQRFMTLTEWFANRLLPERFRVPIIDFAARFIVGLTALRSGRGLVMIFLTSVVIWLLETVKYWFVMHAFDFSVSFFALMLMNGVVNLATTLPSAPGYIGTFDGPGIAVLTLYGVDAAIATAYTLTLHAALWLPITLLGIYYMVRIQMTWADIGRAVDAGRDDGGDGVAMETDTPNDAGIPEHEVTH